MNQKILAAGLIFLVILVLGCAKPSENEQNPELENKTVLAGNYSTQPFMECVDCVNGQTWDNKSCCTENFENECLSAGGVIRWSDLHPAFTVLKGCFQKAPDAGKECASGNGCMSGVCDLESAVGAHKCTLIKKELTGEKNRYGNDDFYTATYSCIADKPGKCEETVKNRLNPGGVLHYFRMNGTVLIEILESGPIS